MAKILVAEDDESVRAFVARALKMDRHEVVEASDGQEGLERLQRGAFDLLLSDIRMPSMDGIALAHAARRKCPDMPIVLMTGYADQRERASSLDGVVQEVLLKPFSLGRVRDCIRHVLSAA